MAIAKENGCRAVKDLRKELEIDVAAEIDRSAEFMRRSLRDHLHRRGLVVALSGGVDSSVCAALAVKAIGAKKVFGLLLPERDSSSDSVKLGEAVAKQLGIEYRIQDIAPTLEAIGCYAERDEAIRRVEADFDDSWKCKIVITGGIEGGLNHFKLVTQSPQGEIKESVLKLREYLQIVAATNYKQRIRKTIEYYHADRLNYAVVGTPNRLEYDQGFFVKNGDGSADIKPIAHLYKTQVYAMARELGLPDAICNSTPSTDTYSMEQGQDEFYFALPYYDMDVALWAVNNDRTPAEVAEAIGISVDRAEHVITDIAKKRGTTGPLHWKALTIERVKGVVESPRDLG